MLDRAAGETVGARRQSFGVRRLFLGVFRHDDFSGAAAVARVTA
jgi:hypothetical protein